MLRKYILFLLLSVLFTSCGQETPSGTAQSENTATYLITNTASIDPTPVPTLVQSPTPDLLVPIQNLNRVLPEDIIQEIVFYGGAGGGGEPGCWNDSYKTPKFLSTRNGLSELMQQLVINVCGIPSNVDVSITVEMPNGETRQSKMTPEKSNWPNEWFLIYEYIPLVDDPVGNYRFTFSGQTWSLTYPISIIRPEKARLYLYESELFFLGFSPNENVRLMVYLLNEAKNQVLEYHWDLYGWTNYKMDANGDYRIPLKNIKNTKYVAVGEISGNINYDTPEGYNIYERYSAHCVGALPPTGIIPLKYAEVIIDNIPTYKIDTDTESWTKAKNISIEKGAVVKITSNAYCYADSYLWSVECTNGQQCNSFVPESGSDGYYLRPMEVLPPTPTPDPSNIPICQGTKPTRLRVGMSAEVTTSGMAPQLSLRAEPSLSAEKVHVIAAGRDMVILKGPVCAENTYWWYIRSEQGFEGWAREGDNEDYWIDPLP